MKNLTLALLITGLMICSCQKESPDYPGCISNLIETQKDEIGAVYSYTYLGETVYEFTPKEDCCDFQNAIYSVDCTVICMLNGITGNQICKGDTFYLKATDKTLLWNRK